MRNWRNVSMTWKRSMTGNFAPYLTRSGNLWRRRPRHQNVQLDFMFAAGRVTQLEGD